MEIPRAREHYPIEFGEMSKAWVVECGRQDGYCPTVTISWCRLIFGEQREYTFSL